MLRSSATDQRSGLRPAAKRTSASYPPTPVLRPPWIARHAILHSGVIATVLLAGLSGCGGTNWFKNGLLDPTQVGQFSESKRNEIRQSLSILEQPLGIQNAEEPTPEDLAPSSDELPIGPGDVLVISIFELLTPGQPTVQQVRVGHSGTETIPMVGPVPMAGLTPRQLELEIKRRLREGGLIENADVQVTVSQSQYAQYSIVGSVGRAGVYPIPQPEYRLLTALAAAGGIPFEIQKIYVFQQGRPPVASPPSTPPPPEATPFTLSDISSGKARGRRDPPPEQTTSVPETETEPAAELPPSPPPDEPEGEPEWDEEAGEWVIRPRQPSAEESPAVAQPTTTAETPPTEGEPPPADAPSEPAAEPTRPPTPPITDEPDRDLAPPVRILEIPVKELMEGDPRYNIVIRPYDLINVPPGNVGEFYMMGNIARPGAYTLTGRRLTVKEAVASAGGFGPLAWPARADLIRRVSEDEEQIIQLDLDKIFAGEAPDFYLKPNDMVNVGTTPAAMFFAVLRNAFRFTYGMGFVYDRNFADADTFQAREQVKTRRRAEAQARGLPF